MKDPKFLAFNLHRRGAGYRKIDFHFTFESWCQWWEQHLGPDWFSKRGRGHGQYVMARNGDSGPYHPDNVKCITHSENSREQTKKIRVAKLTPEEVIFIYQALRARTHGQKRLAKQFHVCLGTVKAINRKQSWRNVTDLLD